MRCIEYPMTSKMLDWISNLSQQVYYCAMLEWQMSRALVLPLHPHMKESKTKIIMDFSDFSIEYKTLNQSLQILTHSTLFMWANYLCKLCCVST